MRLLLVEDNDLSVELFEDVLIGAGHEVVTARDGIIGERLGRTEKWDLILLDLHLPGLAGEDVCRSLRSAGVKTPIVAISASALQDEIDHAMAAGLDGYLTKPISPVALREAVERYAAREALAR